LTWMTVMVDRMYCGTMPISPSSYVDKDNTSIPFSKTALDSLDRVDANMDLLFDSKIMPVTYRHHPDASLNVDRLQQPLLDRLDLPGVF